MITATVPALLRARPSEIATSASVAHLKLNGTAIVTSFAATSRKNAIITRSFRSARAARGGLVKLFVVNVHFDAGRRALYRAGARRPPRRKIGLFQSHRWSPISVPDSRKWSAHAADRSRHPFPSRDSIARRGAKRDRDRPPRAGSDGDRHRREGDRRARAPRNRAAEGHAALRRDRRAIPDDEIGRQGQHHRGRRFERRRHRRDRGARLGHRRRQRRNRLSMGRGPRRISPHRFHRRRSGRRQAVSVRGSREQRHGRPFGRNRGQRHAHGPERAHGFDHRALSLGRQRLQIRRRQLNPQMANLKNVCVYCGSAKGSNPAYSQAARALGSALAREKIRLVYGGGGIGMMGEVARGVEDAGGKVLGFWDPLLVLFKHLGAEGYLYNGPNFLVAERIEDVVPKLRAALASVPEAELHGKEARVVAEGM